MFSVFINASPFLKESDGIVTYYQGLRPFSKFLMLRRQGESFRIHLYWLYFFIKAL